MRRKYRLLHIALSRKITKIRVQQEKFILWAGLDPGGLGTQVLTPWPGDAPRFRVGEYPFPRALANVDEKLRTANPCEPMFLVDRGMEVS